MPNNQRNNLSENMRIVAEEPGYSFFNIKNIILLGLLLSALFIGGLWFIGGLDKSLMNDEVTFVETTPNNQNSANTVTNNSNTLDTSFESANENLFNDTAIQQKQANVDDSNDPIQNKLKKLVKELKNDQDTTMNNQPSIDTKSDDKSANAIDSQPQDIRKMTKTPSDIAKKGSSATQPGYYIQVGAFYTKAPEKKFLDSITNKGYNYYFYKVKINSSDVTKVLVGPYESKADALSNLPGIKQTIDKFSYILKID